MPNNGDHHGGDGPGSLGNHPSRDADDNTMWCWETDPLHDRLTANLLGIAGRAAYVWAVKIHRAYRRMFGEPLL